MIPSYAIIPSLYQRPGERPPVWVCTCPGRKPRERHADPWGCIPVAEVLAWRRAHPEATCGDATARRLFWLESNFSRGHP